MAYNNSTQSNGASPLTRKINYRVPLSVCLSAFFLYINGLLLTVFFKKEVFRRSMRYILFAYTLISDCLYLSLTNLLALSHYFGLFIHIHICLLIQTVVSVYTFVFPLTLTAMTLERYVAICMPMQHAALCTQQNALHCILIITIISSLPITIGLSAYWASLPLGINVDNNRYCSNQMLVLQRWHSHLKIAVNQIYFLIMVVIVVLCYVKITNAARKASGETKKSSGKGLRTVILHGIQLFLCLLRFWCPFVEDYVMQIDLMLFINVRYADYIIFTIAPRCLSSLVYGLRDRKLFLMLKYYAACGFFYRSPPAIND